MARKKYQESASGFHFVNSSGMLRVASRSCVQRLQVNVNRCFCVANEKPLPGASPPDLKKPFLDEIRAPVLIDINEKPPAPKITTLDNGLRVTTLDWQSQGGGVGMEINTGSRYETLEETGVAHYCEKLGFKSGMKYTLGDIMMECETRGANIISQQSREQILFEVEGLRDDLPPILELLADSVVHPKFDPAEFEEQRFLIAHTVANTLNDPELWPLEVCNNYNIDHIDNIYL